jgi:sugar/nucleoside kinase (ribokinase family)
MVGRDDIVHISGYYMLPRLQDALAPLLHDLRGRGVRISFDPGWPPSGFNARERAKLKSILPCVDYFEPKETELLAMTAMRTIDTAVKRIKRWFTGVLALKCGRRGSIIFAEDTPVYSKAFRIVPLDTTGAGDVFDAAFLTGIISGSRMQQEEVTRLQLS